MPVEVAGNDGRNLQAGAATSNLRGGIGVFPSASIAKGIDSPRLWLPNINYDDLHMFRGVDQVLKVGD